MRRDFGFVFSNGTLGDRFQISTTLNLYHFVHPAVLQSGVGDGACGVLWYSGLVRKIQLRLVRILDSELDGIKYENRVPNPPSSQPTFSDILDSSWHNMVKRTNHFRCLDCGGSCRVSAKGTRRWFKSPCNPSPYDDAESWVPIPKWHVVQIGHTPPHTI